ncbi:MAG: glycosyltransferase family 4 protein [Candidatus Portnoybacteria bacterium]|nr:glycosyltransferase family 4 protein [Candidatus Portnoybacteria bacterium]
MKIAMIGQKGIPTLFGGIERHVEKISCSLAREKNREVFVYARSYYTPKKTKKFKGVNIIHLPSIQTKHLDAISHIFLASWHAVFKIRADVIHYHGVGPALCLWIPKLFKPSAKVVFTLHCHDYFHKKWGSAARFFLRFGEMIGCLLADEVIAVSEEIQEYIAKTYKRKSSFIPHGVDEEEKIPANLIVRKWGLKKDGYILAVSRLIPHKGIHYLIEAYQKIKTDKKLVIVGPSFYTRDYKNELAQRAKNDTRIIFLDAQQGKILKELFSNACLFINPSEQEGLPVTVLEAASFGVPILLSDIKIHKKMLGDNVFLFRNKSVKNLAEEMEKILGEQKTPLKKSRQAKNYLKNNYDSWAGIVEKTVLKYI